MSEMMAPLDKETQRVFQEQINLYRYDFCKLVYVLFPFGQKDHDLENMAPYEWQMKEWKKMSAHYANIDTRFDVYRLIISSGNGAAKTAFGAMTLIMLMYTQSLRARITANTQPQMTTIVWPELEIWFRRARLYQYFFEIQKTSIQTKKPDLTAKWRIDSVNWSEQSPTAISGLHNKGGAVAYVFEEAPGIPAKIWQYAAGAFTETDTMKLFMAFGNSDEPDSKFEQNMTSPIWNALRLDTRTLRHIDPNQIKDWLIEAGGDEDDDDFRVRVRGLPRKSSKDSIIKLEAIQAAIGRGTSFDKASVRHLPVILSCDPAWTGGDQCCIWYRQGQYCCMLELYRLDKALGENHTKTYDKLCYWERRLGADCVLIDQGEGTGIYTMAMNAEKDHWELISFGSSANDAMDSRDSEYGNIRAQMYHEGAQMLQKGGVLDAKDPKWFPLIEKQFTWTKGSRHKITGKKMCNPKGEIKEDIGQSPDVADGFVLLFARAVHDRLPQNETYRDNGNMIGGEAFTMPDHNSPYEVMDADYTSTYD